MGYHCQSGHPRVRTTIWVCLATLTFHAVLTVQVLDDAKAEGRMFLLVLAYPGCPGTKAIKRPLLLLATLTFHAVLTVPVLDDAIE